MEEEELELEHAAKKPRDITKKIKVSASCIGAQACIRR